MKAMAGLHPQSPHHFARKPSARASQILRPITGHVLMNGNEHGVKGVELLAVFGSSMSKEYLDNGVPETIKGKNILEQRLRPGVFKEKQVL